MGRLPGSLVSQAARSAKHLEDATIGNKPGSRRFPACTGGSQICKPIGRESRIGKAQAMEQPRTIPIAMSPPVDLLSRYLRGDHCRVWQELHSHEAVGGDLLEEARAVAAETMKRVAAAADLLAERLAARGWKPLGGLSEHMRTRPSPKDDFNHNKTNRSQDPISAAAEPPCILAICRRYQFRVGLRLRGTGAQLRLGLVFGRTGSAVCRQS